MEKIEKFIVTWTLPVLIIGLAMALVITAVLGILLAASLIF